MDALQLKEYIIENESIPHILESLNCHSVKKYQNEYRCAMPDKTNTTAISVKADSLKTKMYAKDNIVKGDIITLAMELKNYKFINALKHIHETLGLKFVKILPKTTQEKYDPLAIFKKAKNKINNADLELKIYDEKILDNYLINPNIWLIKEGIAPDTQIKFNVGFCHQQSRIVIPHKFWSGGDNDYVGIMGRTIIEEYKLLDIPKYYPLLAFPKSLNLYGLQENYSEIQKAGVVVVFESEKSVMKMDTWKYRNAVALGGKEITPEQIKILVSLNVEICFAFDVGISEEYILDCCSKFKYLRNTSYIFDRDELLLPKMSPVDRRIKTFNYLFNNRIRNTIK